MRNQYRRLQLDVLKHGKFLRFCEVSYEPLSDNTMLEQKNRTNNSISKWELVQRTTGNIPLNLRHTTPVPFAIDCAEICALLSRGEDVFLILVAQYRPPLDAVVIEFPAGLVDPEEDVKAAALRELHEETGYTASLEDVISVSDALCLEPGLSDSCSKFVKIRVDGDKEANHSPQPHLQDGEDIEVILLPLRRGKTEGVICTPLEQLRCMMNERGMTENRAIIDARLAMFLEGLSYAVAMTL